MWFSVAPVGLVCVERIKTDGRRDGPSVVSVPNSGLIFAGDVESPLIAAVAVVAAVAKPDRNRCCR